MEKLVLRKQKQEEELIAKFSLLLEEKKSKI
jgi:hypothetical protein